MAAFDTMPEGCFHFYSNFEHWVIGMKVYSFKAKKFLLKYDNPDLSFLLF